MEQSLQCHALSVTRPVLVSSEHDPDSFAALFPPLDDTLPPNLDVTVSVDFQRQGLRREVFRSSLQNFVPDVAKARTFTFEDELARLDAMGLAKGGSLSNAVVYRNDGSCMNEDGQRYGNGDEWARHKALDVFGDLALLGTVHGSYFAVKPGHELNISLAKAVVAAVNHSEGPPNIDAS
eukprot:g1985.t1